MKINKCLALGLNLGLLFILINSVKSANWPDTISSDSNLYIAVNNCATYLTAAVNNSVTSLSVADTTDFPTVGYVTIGSEAIKYTGKTANSFTGCTRGADGTSAAAHSVNATVFHAVIADHHNVLKDELIAMSTYFFQGATLHIDTTNARIGIGTTSPGKKLDIASDMLLSGTRSIIFTTGDNTTTHRGGVQFLTSDNGLTNIWTPTDQNGNTVDSMIRFGGFNVYNNNIVNLAVSGNVGIGTTSPATKLHMSSGIFTLDGTTPYITFSVVSTTPTAAANEVSIWGVDEGNGEMKVIDGDGNVTKISPHNNDGEWEYHSCNQRTGKCYQVNMEKIISVIERLSGMALHKEWYEPIFRHSNTFEKMRR